MIDRKKLHKNRNTYVYLYNEEWLSILQIVSIYEYKTKAGLSEITKRFKNYFKDPDNYKFQTIEEIITTPTQKSNQTMIPCAICHELYKEFISKRWVTI